MDDTRASRRAVVSAVSAVARVLARAATAGTVKGWRDQHPASPHGRYDLPLIDYWQPRVARARRNLWSHGALVAAITTARQFVPLTKAPAADDAWRQFIASIARGSLQASVDAAELRDVLRRLTIEAWVTGAYVASTQTGLDHPAYGSEWTADVVAGTAWDTWQPGWIDAAITVADGGLADLLDGAGVRIGGMTGTALDDLGNAIADGLLNGDSVDAIARGLEGMLGDAYRALLIAQTETARAMTEASLDTYDANGIRQFDWIVTDGACPFCLNQESGNPHDRGDPVPPGHPLCRCAVGPALRSTPMPGFPDAITVDLDGDATVAEA